MWETFEDMFVNVKVTGAAYAKLSLKKVIKKRLMAVNDDNIDVEKYIEELSYLDYQDKRIKPEEGKSILLDD